MTISRSTPVPGAIDASSAATLIPHIDGATVVWVTLRVRPAEEARFLAAAATLAERSLTTEPGCLQYDIVALDPAVCVYGIYEVYADETALAAHRAAPHYAEWEAVAPSFFEEGGASICIGVRMVLPSAVNPGA